MDDSDGSDSDSGWVKITGGNSGVASYTPKKKADEPTISEADQEQIQRLSPSHELYNLGEPSRTLTPENVSSQSSCLDCIKRTLARFVGVKAAEGMIGDVKGFPTQLRKEFSTSTSMLSQQESKKARLENNETTDWENAENHGGSGGWANW